MAKLTASGIFFATGNELNSRRQIFATSTAWVFHQTTAPTGWTKSTSNNDKAFRLVSGSGGVAGGTSSFSTVMADRTIGGPTSAVSVPTTATGDTTLTTTQIPVHNHGASGTNGLDAVPQLFNPDGVFIGWNGGDVQRAGGWTRSAAPTGDTTPAPARGQAHSHPFSGSASISAQPMNIAVNYIDVLICTFDG